MLSKLLYSATIAAAVVRNAVASPVGPRDGSSGSCPAPTVNSNAPKVEATPAVKKLVLAPVPPPAVTNGRDFALAEADSFFWVLPEQGMIGLLYLRLTTY